MTETFQQRQWRQQAGKCSVFVRTWDTNIWPVKVNEMRVHGNTRFNIKWYTHAHVSVVFHTTINNFPDQWTDTLPRNWHVILLTHIILTLSFIPHFFSFFLPLSHLTLGAKPMVILIRARSRPSGQQRSESKLYYQRWMEVENKTTCPQYAWSQNLMECKMRSDKYENVSRKVQ